VEELMITFTEEYPDVGRGWALRGYSVHAQGRWDEALEFHMRASEFPELKWTGLYRAGLAHARLGQVDEAFELLTEVKEGGEFEVTQADLDPAATALRVDPRYPGLFPSAEEFATPFVEEVEIFQEWQGEGRGDQFGWIARKIGDVDGDGISDVTTSAPTWGPNGSSAGRVYVYSGGTGLLLWTADGDPGDRLGQGIEAAGDVNGDGVGDVIAGAPGGDRARVWDGATGEVLLELEGGQEGEAFGSNVSDLGDLDGDGFDDVLVGAPGHDGAHEDAGAAYVFSGRTGDLLHRIQGEAPGDALGSSGGGWVGQARGGSFALLVLGAPGAGPMNNGRVYVYGGISEEPAFVIESDEDGAALGGMFVSVVGDVDDDGTPDVYASDWSHGALGPSTGRIHVHSGATGARLLTVTGEASGDGFGIGPADAGDVDGDGHDDLVIGAWQHGGAAPSGGKVYLYSGADGALLATLTGRVMGETLGFDATGMGDMNGDGVPDLLITSAWSSISGGRSGRVFIVSGDLGSGR
jgi:hypothetical protein